ncbi:hypothetical protein KFE98_19735 [bacterium SCSIO 12741]|nr:hypothetical protein KFE98_19735 [bacterium SCSIO 12741]
MSGPSLSERINLLEKRISNSEENKTLPGGIISAKVALILAWVSLFCGLLLGLFGVQEFIIAPGELKLSDFGDYIGGVVGSTWALGGLLLVYVGFIAQKMQLSSQQNELLHSRLELLYTQQEMRAQVAQLEGQKKQMELQNDNLATQRFETTFFNYLTHIDRTKASFFVNKNHTGHKVMELIYLEFQNYIFSRVKREYDGPDPQSPMPDPKYIKMDSEQTWSVAIEAIDDLMVKRSVIFGQFIQLYQQLLKLIRELSISQDPWYYGSILSSTLSISEKRLLFYYAITEDGVYFRELSILTRFVAPDDYLVPFQSEHLDKFHKK